MTNSPDRRVIIVTGGARGIGAAVCRRFLDDGDRVALVDIEPEPAETWARGWIEQDRLWLFRADVAREDDVRRVCRDLRQRSGRLDALVNNAAIAANGPVAELSRETWDRVLAVNLTGPMLWAKHTQAALAACGGAIVNIASTRALMSEPHTEAYSASKAGLVGLTHALAMSLAPAIRVNCISPGWVDVTGGPLSQADHAQHPVGRVGHPEDIAEMVWMLSSDRAGFITGQNIVVDGGMTRKMIYL